jgi:hypothetical protein
LYGNNFELAIAVAPGIGINIGGQALLVSGPSGGIPALIGECRFWFSKKISTTA